jgi:hypothetical protein
MLRSVLENTLFFVLLQNYGAFKPEILTLQPENQEIKHLQ